MHLSATDCVLLLGINLVRNGYSRGQNTEVEPIDLCYRAQLEGSKGRGTNTGGTALGIAIIQ